jgi:small multidrug resistance pump
MRLLFDAVLLSSVLALTHAIMRTIGGRSGQKGLLDMLLSNWFLFLVAVSLYGFVFIYYTAALRYQKLALLYPLYTGLSVILVFAAGVLYFGETVSSIQITGCILLIFGIFLISR